MFMSNRDANKMEDNARTMRGQPEDKNRIENEGFMNVNRKVVLRNTIPGWLQVQDLTGFEDVGGSY